MFTLNNVSVLVILALMGRFRKKMEQPSEIINSFESTYNNCDSLNKLVTKLYNKNYDYQTVI
jgi:hypothetical protein